MTRTLDANTHHLLLTKYNVRFSEESGVKHRGLEDTWLTNRVELFRAGPVHSVNRQSVRPDGWLIFVDSETPPGHVQAIEDASLGLATVVKVDGVFTDARVGELVQTRVPPSTQLLITSRLDNDDYLGCEYIASVRSASITHRGYLNAVSGLQIGDPWIVTRYDRSSPFLSFAEDFTLGSAPKTVFSTPHFRVREQGSVLQLRRAHWLQVIHSDNVANQLEGFPMSARTAETRMGFTLPPRKRSRRSNIPILVKAVGRGLIRLVRNAIPVHIHLRRPAGWRRK